MQTPIIVNAANWNFKKELSQIEYYGMYAFIAEAYSNAVEEDHTPDMVESLFGFAPSGGNISCTNYVEWPGFEHLGPVDYFTLTDNHILCAVFIYDDAPTVYLRLN